MFNSIVLLVSLLSFSEVEVEKLKEKHDHEVAAEGRVTFDKKINEEKFLSCVPRESIAFPKDLPESFAKKIFEEDQLSDLMKCDSEHCVFNFLPIEVKVLEKLRSPEDRKTMYFKFYQNRVHRLTPIDPNRSPHFIRSKENAFFEDCKSDKLSSLLDDRPISQGKYRLSAVRYEDRMRPTTRLLQGISYQTSPKISCYAEALIFSDHYDEDRVEVWKRQENEKSTTIQLQIRHRVDLLNSWLRRLNKEAFRKQIRKIISEQLQEVATCLEK